MNKTNSRAVVSINAFNGKSKFENVVDWVLAHIWVLLNDRFQARAFGVKGMWVKWWCVWESVFG